MWQCIDNLLVAAAEAGTRRLIAQSYAGRAAAPAAGRPRPRRGPGEQIGRPIRMSLAGVIALTLLADQGRCRAPARGLKARGAILPYRPGMARKQPTSEDAAAARRVLLDGLARDAQVFELLGELELLHPRNDTFPGEVFLRLAADALDWCRASRTNPLQLEGLRERFLPEVSFRGRQNKKFQYAVLAAAALHGGTEPDLLEEVAWWQSDDFWEYALYAAAAYIRAAASQAGVPGRQACQDLAPQGHPRHNTHYRGPPAIETATMSSVLRSSRVLAGMHKLAGTIGWVEAVRAALRLITCGS